jgi:shikimate 5-dehydrogenase
MDFFDIIYYFILPIAVLAFANWIFINLNAWLKPLDLARKHVVITGGSAGIGKSIA